MRRLAVPLALAAAVAAAAGSASAQPITPAPSDPAPNVLRVQVGKTVERPVGILRGYFCDDPALISADMITRGDVNVWIVTGAKAGSTRCRVGDMLHPFLLFDVVVTAKEP